MGRLSGVNAKAHLCVGERTRPLTASPHTSACAHKQCQWSITMTMDGVGAVSHSVWVSLFSATGSRVSGYTQGNDNQLTTFCAGNTRGGIYCNCSSKCPHLSC